MVRLLRKRIKQLLRAVSEVSRRFARPNWHSGCVSAADHDVTFLTRSGCHLCHVAHEVLNDLQSEFGFAVEVIDIDAVAAERPELRAEYGDRVPVVLLDGREHSYWEVDVPRFRRDISA